MRNYVEIMLFRDVVERWNVQNIAVLQRLKAKVLQSFTKDISVHRWYNDFRSQGMKTGKDTLYEYLRYLEEALFVFTVHNEVAPSGSRKVYLVDNGLYQGARDRPDTGKLLENQVSVDTLRSGNRKPGYYRAAAGEIDFVTATHLIQVCTELSADNHHREFGPLQASEVRERFTRRQCGIVTLESYPGIQPVG